MAISVLLIANLVYNIRMLAETFLISSSRHLEFAAFLVLKRQLKRVPLSGYVFDMLVIFLTNDRN